MPWRLFFSLIVVIFAILFIALNLNNICTVWLFKEFTDIPVFMPSLISFVLGCMFTLVCVLSKSLKARKKRRQEQADLPVGTSGISFTKSKKPSQEIKEQELEAFSATPGGAEKTPEV